MEKTLNRRLCFPQHNIRHFRSRHHHHRLDVDPDVLGSLHMDVADDVAEGRLSQKSTHVANQGLTRLWSRVSAPRHDQYGDTAGLEHERSARARRAVRQTAHARDLTET